MIHSGTLYFTQSSTSRSRRAFDLCTIWLTAKGAAGASGLAWLWRSSSSVIRFSQVSSIGGSPSFSRAFSAGKEPTTPALHWAMTSSG